MIKHYIKSLIELDYTKYPYILIFIIVYLLSRIPFLNLGFGNDPDAWRIANSAFDLNHVLIYHTSRFPGYPLPEYVNSLVINYGWLATNSLTMILTLISVLVFAKILKELDFTLSVKNIQRKPPTIQEESDPENISVTYWDHGKNIDYVYMTSADDIIQWENNGYEIYYMGQAAFEVTKLNYKYDLSTYNTSNIFESINL